MFSLARALPSPTSAEDCSSLFDWFIGSTAQSDSSGVCMLALWLWAFANRSRSWLDRGAPLFKRFSKLNSPAHRYPRPTLRSTPRDGDRKIRGQDGFASPFLYDSFIRYNMPVYPGAPRETPVTSREGGAGIPAGPATSR